MTDKQEDILKDLKKKAQDLRFGVLIVEFKIHDGEIAQGEVIRRREKLG